MELLAEEDHQEAGEEPLGGSHGAAPRGTKKQKDFVRRNTEVCQSSRRAKRRTAVVYRMTCGRRGGAASLPTFVFPVGKIFVSGSGGGKRHNLSFCFFASNSSPLVSTQQQQQQQHVSREGDDLTQADRERLAELLQEIDREEEDGAKSADSEVG